MSSHADLLKLLLPAIAYDKTAPSLAAELGAHGARLDAFQDVVDTLLVETDPRTTTALLPDWERVYGLPDSCVGPGATIGERRAYLVAKVAETGGLSKPYFQNLAAVLGYQDTTITSFRPTNCEGYCEEEVIDEVWRRAWRVNLSHEVDNHRFFCADSGCTEVLDYYLTGPIECLLTRLKPADTFILFRYQ